MFATEGMKITDSAIDISGFDLFYIFVNGFVI